ncbi:unnamed protein product [Dovyalis caffra]|uniref:non-specific serine/threonine protein kinase n=1 Tax=Dovyalis caffra TaxID=77055 RepID=A0AAV1S524_9ROSI|nr:unnamed protein product [Dovyalis caffra]
MASICHYPKLLANATILFLVLVSSIVVACTGLVAALDSALLASEGKALLESGWWSSYDDLTNLNRCTWPGIVCNQAGSVVEISPPSESLKVRDKFGKMNFSCFSNLVRLDLAEHQLNGTIPPKISTLPKLRYLDLSSNHLTGKLINLRYLDLSANQINESIPVEIGNLANLVTLDLSLNNISGSIPTTLGDILSSSAQAIQLKEVLDPRLSKPTNEIIRQNICIIATLAFSCLHSKPESRPSMKFVSQEFINPKRPLVGLEISLLELQNCGMHTNGEITVPC